MATTVGELNVKLNLELQRLDAQITQANQKIARMSKSWQSEFAKTAKNINAALSVVGAGLGVGAIVNFGKSLIDLGGNIVDLSAQAGVSTDAFQTMSIAGLDSGVSADQMAQAFVKLKSSLQDAVAGSEKMQESFSKLHINAQALQALAPERQMEILGRSILGAANQNEAFAAAMDILGTKQGPKLLAFLKELGAEGFDKIAEQTAKFRLSPEQLKTLDDAGDKLGRLLEYTKLLGASALVKSHDFGKAYAEGVTSAIDTVGAKLKDLAPKGVVGPGMVLPVPGITAPSKPMAAPVAPAINEAQKAQDKLTESVKQYETELANVQAKTDYLNRANSVAATSIMGVKLGYDSTAQSSENFAALTSKLNDAVGIFGTEGAESFDRVIDRTTMLKEIGADLDKQKPWVFDPKAIDAATLAWDRFETEQKTLDEVDSKLRDFFGPIDEQQQELNARSLKAQEGWSKEMQHITRNAADGMTDAFVDFFNGTEGGFKNLGLSIAREIEQIVVKMLVVAPIMRMIGSLIGGIGGGGAFGGIASAFMNYGGAHASGGTAPGGKVSLVGERGPELIVPKTSSTVIPNDKLGMGEGRQGDTYNIDARGADEARIQQLERTIVALNGSVERRAVSAVTSMNRRRPNTTR
jgi:hypothetical protein